MAGRRGRRRKHLLDDIQEKRGYWKLNEEAVDRLCGEARMPRLGFGGSI